MTQTLTRTATPDTPRPPPSFQPRSRSSRPRPAPPRREEPPTLVFAPLAWLKLRFFCHAGDTEVGGFAVSAGHDPLYVQDFVTVRQYTTAVTVEFEDAAVADHFDDAVDAGLTPARCARIWCHTHLGDSPEPSTTDEHTFARVFGACDWSVMFILSRTGRTYARLGFSAGPGGSLLLAVDVDWEAWPQVVLERPDEMAALLTAWAAEFDRNVHPVCLMLSPLVEADGPFPRLSSGIPDPWDGLDRLQAAQVEAEYGDPTRPVAAGEETPRWRT